MPRRSVAEVTLISCLQDQASSRSSGDLLLLRGTRSQRASGRFVGCGHHLQLAARADPLGTGMPRAGSTAQDREWGSGGGDYPEAPYGTIAGDKQQKGRDGSKTPAAIRAGNGDGMIVL